VTEPGISQERLLTKDGEPWTPGQRAYDAETGRVCQVGLTHEIRASWPTPTVPNGGRQPKGGAMTTTGQTPDGKKRQVDINFIAQATWPTPTTRDGKDGSFCPNVPTNSLLGREAWSGDGEPTEKKGALNPEFVCWLMGLPIEWDGCGVTVTRSSRKSRQRS